MNNGKKLKETLKRLDYPEAHELQAEAFDWLFENDAVAPFLDWFIDNVGPANVLSKQEIAEFHTLESSGDGVLEGEKLNTALRSSNTGDEDDLSPEKLKDDIEAMEEELHRAQKNRKSLLQLRNKLSLHHTSLTHQLTKLTPVESHTESQYKNMLENSQEDNFKVNTSLDDLNKTITELVALSAKSLDTQHAPFMSQQPLQAFHQSEESYTQALKQFTKRQFFEGIAQLAGHNEGSRYELLEVSEPGSLVIRGEQCHVTEADCEELARLKTLYPASQRGYMKALLEESRVTAAHRLAEKRLDSISHQLYPRDVHSLSEKLEQCERQKNAALNQAVQIWESEIPRLLEVNASLQATHILSGDYNLKVARQDYFTSKQEKLIELLSVQRARKEFLDMAYEVEAHHHRATHRLMTASTKLLQQDLTMHHRSMGFLSDPDLNINTETRSTVDSRDQTVNRLHEMIGLGGKQEQQLFLTYSGLLEDSRVFVNRLSSLRDNLRLAWDSQEGQLAALERNLTQCENMVYAGSTTKDGQPVLTPPAILDGIAQLERMLEDLTQGMMDLMGDYNNKLKTLKSDPLLSEQRQLFVYFFTEPVQLKRQLQSLSQQLQALTIS
ncbi:HAUS augmin-like complex subunit 3 [Strongylocentrotus purpuratus]|uniref:HAUS augmin-like complex subunit 3 N-terminal domain-containing protein n=1 Tax=Strongylocentrotus purpuratus TaxID=7668 RepID=A0A7M7NBG0_STRPU|nr:HAUS augmin-like complex subunit 3 [Strongylocentrotus purpuratus]